jgi:intracellular multiplication protein IcmP
MTNKGMPSHSQNDLSDPTVLILLFCLIIGFGIFMWMGFHTLIVTVNIYIRYIMGYPVYLVSSLFKDVPFLSYPYDYIQTYCDPEPEIFGLCRKDMSKFTWDDLINLSLPWNVFFGLILIIALIKDFIEASKKHPQARFNRVHNLDSFIQEQKQIYSHLKMFAKLNLINEPINHPIFGMSLTSKQFVGLYALTRENSCDDWQELEDGTFLPIIDQEALQNILIKQLGSIWQGWKKLSDTELIIFAALLPLVAAKNLSMSDNDFEQAKLEAFEVRQNAWEMFNYDNVTNDSIDCSSINADEQRCLWLLEPHVDRNKYYSIIEKYRTNNIVQQVMSHHAFVRTMIYGLLTHARMIGVLEPADFRWLRFCDRSLWYVIQSVGRRCPFAEAAAVHDHYNYEIFSKIAIYTPYIKNAVIGINEEVAKFKYPSRNLLSGDYSIWFDWRALTIQKLYPGIDINKTLKNLKNK